MEPATHVYRGDTASYGVIIIRTTHSTTKVKIVGKFDPESSLPLGAIVTVPTHKLV